MASSLSLGMMDIQASLCRDSFFEFVQEYWETIIAETPVWNWHIPYMCEELQYLAERVFDGKPKEHDLIINVPPGSTKSTICSVMFPAWLWTRMESARCICGSHTAPLALNLSRLSRIIVQSDKYQSMFPGVTLSEDQNTKGCFVTDKMGGRLATMVGGSVTGFHAHFLIVDDPLDPKKAASSADLRTANDWMRETLPTRKVDKSIAVTILIMQRLHEDDCTGNWLERVKTGKSGRKNRIKHICLPAEMEGNDVFPEELEDEYVDGLLDPIRLSKVILADQENDLGEFAYAAQFDQCPVPRGGGDFKTDKIVVEAFAPHRFKKLVRYWDKAGTKGAGCYTAGVLLGLDDDGFSWVLDVSRGQWDAWERERNIKQCAEIDGDRCYNYVEQEPGSGGKDSALATIKNLQGFRIYADRPTGDKETRAEPAQCQVNAGTVKMLRGEWNKAFINELRYFPNSKYKDQVDAFSGAFTKLTKKKRRAGAL